jgi:hypothetical protein
MMSAETYHYIKLLQLEKSISCASAYYSTYSIYSSTKYCTPYSSNN